MGRIEMRPHTLPLLASGNGKEGDVLGVVRISGIQGAKKTNATKTSQVLCRTTTETVELTGLEMEARTAVQLALLTIYNFCKAVGHGLVSADINRPEKHGRQSGSFVFTQR